MLSIKLNQLTMDYKYYTLESLFFRNYIDKNYDEIIEKFQTVTFNLKQWKWIIGKSLTLHARIWI